ncbi:MAG: hypothetical protein IJC25_04585 [Clostridia bacterium]|nr:hypothetical protein [Clostridia bacterium]
MPTFTNQATLSYNGITVSSNIVSGELVETLSVTKTAVTDSYRSGDRVTYVVQLLNTGAAPFTGVTLSDDLGAYPFDTTTRVPLTYLPDSLLYYVNGTLQATPAVTAGPPLTVTGLSVPADGNATVIYQAAVNAFAPLAADSSITNTVTAGGAGISAPVTASETVTVSDEAQLGITKSVSPATVSENGELTYTFLIQNTGNTAVAATDNLTVTDVFDPILDPITVTLNGALLVAGTDYTYNSATGEFATVPGQITVPAATYAQDPVTGVWSVTPGTAVLVVRGIV